MSEAPPESKSNPTPEELAQAALRAAQAAENVASAGPIKGVWAGLVLLYEIVKGAKDLASFIRENRNEKWFQESFEIHRALRTAKTPEEKRAIARRIRDSLAGLG